MDGAVKKVLVLAAALGIGLVGADPRAEAPSFLWPRVENTAFGPGERLVFSIRYGIVPAGEARLEVLPSEIWAGRTVYPLRSTARSHPALDVLFKVRDESLSWVDAESLVSLRFFQDIREGLYRRKKETTVDPLAGRFLARRWKKGVESRKEGPTAPFVQDPLSCLYFLRTLSLEVGQIHTLDVRAGSDAGPLRVRVAARETVKVPAGRFECFRLEPTAVGEGLFNAQGRLTVWVTADARRWPVLLKSKVAVGSFSAELREAVPAGSSPGAALSAPREGVLSPSES